MRVRAGERLALKQAVVELLREGECVPDTLTEMVREAEDDRVTDTQAVEDPV